jgi:chromosome transmission fidelity protein 18
MQQMRKKTTAPDANLMNLMKRRHRTSTPVMKLSKYGKSAILLKPKEGQASVPMTLANGTRIYVKTTSVENRDTSKNNNNSAEIFPTCSLGVTMKELKRRSDLIQRKCSLRKNDNISSSKRGIVDNGQLWVDKHAPSSFTHLLSDERTNREVLRALRAWDPYVFGKKAPARPISYIQFQKQQQNDTDGINKPPENPHDKRPDESNRVILLAGPPGVGM